MIDQPTDEFCHPVDVVLVNVLAVATIVGSPEERHDTDPDEPRIADRRLRRREREDEVGIDGVVPRECPRLLHDVPGDPVTVGAVVGEACGGVAQPSNRTLLDFRRPDGQQGNLGPCDPPRRAEKEHGVGHAGRPHGK